MDKNAVMLRTRQFPRSHPVWTGLIALVIVIALLPAVIGWNWARGPVARLVEASTGREFRIEGNLDVDFFPLEVQAERLYLGNARWSDEAAMARVDRLDMQVRFWPLLVGQVRLPAVVAESPSLLLERSKEGRGNWVLGETSGSSCGPTGCDRGVRVQQLLVRDGEVRFREPALETSLHVRIESGKPASKDSLAPLLLSGKGTYRGRPFTLEGQVDSPLELQGEPQPYQLDLRAAAGDTRARLHGTLEEPLQWQDISLNFALAGADLAKLYDVIGIVLPRTPPYELAGILTRNGNTFGYRRFAGTVGDSDLAGNLEVKVGGERPMLTGKLHSKLIDFDDLAGFIGGVPGTGEGETASEEQREQAARQRESGRRLPSTPIKLERLRAMDADVQLTAERVDSPRLPLETMRAHLVLHDGQLTLQPLDFGAAGGTLSNVVRIDARGEPAQFGMVMRVQGLELPKLMPRVEMLRDAVGNISGVIELEGEGDSAATVMATANGDMSVIMGSGRISNLLMEIAGLDVAESLGFLIGSDKPVTVRCAYADFGVEEGIATARAVAFDTTDTVILMDGKIDFRDEKLDLDVMPRPKDFSPVSIRVPLHIGGTLAKPTFAPRAEPLLLRIGLVSALAMIAPPLALLGLIERGPGEDTGCQAETGGITADAGTPPIGDEESGTGNKKKRTVAERAIENLPKHGR